MNKENEYQIVKDGVEQAKLQNAEVSGQIKAIVQNLRELGFSGEINDDAEVWLKNANAYLDKKEPILNKQQPIIEAGEQKIIDKYNKIISSTAPGADLNE